MYQLVYSTIDSQCHWMNYASSTPNSEWLIQNTVHRPYNDVATNMIQDKKTSYSSDSLTL